MHVGNWMLEITVSKIWNSSDDNGSCSNFLLTSSFICESSKISTFCRLHFTVISSSLPLPLLKSLFTQ